MEDVGHYIVVVPGGLKFMKILQGLIKLLQVQTLKLHNRTEWLDLPTEDIFDVKVRLEAQKKFTCLQKVHGIVDKAAHMEIKSYQRKTEMLNYYIKSLERDSQRNEHPAANNNNALKSEVDAICGKMQQVMSMVSDLEKTCGTNPDLPNDPFEQIALTDEVSQIINHHNWPSATTEEYTHKISCMSILEMTSRILSAGGLDNINPLNPCQVGERNLNMTKYLQKISLTERELKLVIYNLETDQNRHRRNQVLRPKTAVMYPQRDYQLIEVEDCDLGACFTKLQLMPELMLPQQYRLCLNDILPEPGAVLSPVTGSTLNLTSDHTSSRSLLGTTGKSFYSTVKKRTKAMSVLKTISRNKCHKRSKVNMDALKELARNGFNEAMLDSSTITWKKKSGNGTSRAEISESDTTTQSAGATRLSGMFSDMVPKFNSTAIFNSTTIEHPIAFSDITNKEDNLVNKESGLFEGRSHFKQFQEIAKSEEQENILDCSDSVLIN